MMVLPRNDAEKDPKRTSELVDEKVEAPILHPWTSRVEEMEEEEEEAKEEADHRPEATKELAHPQTMASSWMSETNPGVSIDVSCDRLAQVDES